QLPSVDDQLRTATMNELYGANLRRFGPFSSRTSHRSSPFSHVSSAMCRRLDESCGLMRSSISPLLQQRPLMSPANDLMGHPPRSLAPSTRPPHLGQRRSKRRRRRTEPFGESGREGREAFVTDKHCDIADAVGASFEQPPGLLEASSLHVRV